jgi:hypothetical protein
MLGAVNDTPIDKNEILRPLVLKKKTTKKQPIILSSTVVLGEIKIIK